MASRKNFSVFLLIYDVDLKMHAFLNCYPSATPVTFFTDSGSKGSPVNCYFRYNMIHGLCLNLSLTKDRKLLMMG